MRSLIAFSLLLAMPSVALAQHEAATLAAPAMGPDQAKVEQAAALIGAGKPAEAIQLLDSLIAAQEKARKGESRSVYCARSPAEALVYSTHAAAERKAAVVLDQWDCYSIFLKGFALIDLKRPDEARPLLERAVAMAPNNAHFLGELGEWYKTHRQWETARSLYRRASEAASLSPQENRTFDKGRALRGLAFILVEEGKFGEAEALYRECLTLDPNDSHAKSELQYIAEHKGKTI